MTNKELIKALRYCGNFEDREGCDAKCPYIDDLYCPQRIMCDAADALEVADKRIKELEAQLPKDGEWIDLFGHDYKCSVCGEWYRMDGTPEQEDMNYCPNCGARMKGANDEADC